MLWLWPSSAVDRGRGAQPVDHVGDRGDRLLGQPREAVEPEALGGARQEAAGRRGATRHRSSESSVGIWKIVGASSGGSTRAIVRQRPGGLGGQVDRAVERSPHSSAEAKASTTASTRASRSTGVVPPSSNRFQPGWRSVAWRPARLISTTRSRTPGSVRWRSIRSRPSPWGSRNRPPWPVRTRWTNWAIAELGLAVARAAGDVGEEGVGVRTLTSSLADS